MVDQNAATKYLSVKNWNTYQRYHDHGHTGRNMKWIMFYPALLDDLDFTHLSDGSKGLWPLLLLLAGITANRLPNDAKWVQHRLHLSLRPYKVRALMDELITAGFLIPLTGAVSVQAGATSVRPRCDLDARQDTAGASQSVGSAPERSSSGKINPLVSQFVENPTDYDTEEKTREEKENTSVIGAIASTPTADLAKLHPLGDALPPSNDLAEVALPSVDSSQSSSSPRSVGGSVMASGNGKTSVIAAKTKIRVKAPADIEFVVHHRREDNSWDFDTAAFTGITDETIAGWAEAFPAVNVKDEILRSRLWLIGKWPSSRKTRYRKFLTAWMARTQERGGDRGSNGGYSAGRFNPPPPRPSTPRLVLNEADLERKRRILAKSVGKPALAGGQ